MKKLTLTTLCFTLVIALKVEASVLYDFEEPRSEDQTTIGDQAGPPYTNFDVKTNRLVEFNGGTGVTFDGSVNLDGTAKQTIDLGLGAEGELNQDWSQGFRLEITFQPTQIYGTHRILYGKYAGGSNGTERSLLLKIHTADDDQTLRLSFFLSGNGMDMDTLMSSEEHGKLTLGEIYTVEVIFDPSAGSSQLKMNLSNVEGVLLDAVERDSVIKNVYISEVPTLIGAGGGGPFIGTMGKVSFQAGSEPLQDKK